MVEGEPKAFVLFFLRSIPSYVYDVHGCLVVNSLYLHEINTVHHCSLSVHASTSLTVRLKEARADLFASCSINTEVNPLTPVNGLSLATTRLMSTLIGKEITAKYRRTIFRECPVRQAISRILLLSAPHGMYRYHYIDITIPVFNIYLPPKFFRLTVYVRDIFVKGGSISFLQT